MTPDVCSDCGERHGDEAGACTGRTRTRGFEAALDLTGFRILGPLGAGAMGTVHLAEDVTLGRRVAIKFVSPNLAADEDVHQRFLREARAMASVQHPNVVRIYSFGEHDGTGYIVMELIEGESLRDYIRFRKQLEVDDALRITRDVVLALEAAWAKGIVHRDVKPSNILLDSARQVHVADFGLARPMASEESSITAQGMLVGTPDYVSPEQARGERLDCRSDIYSLGIVVYEMLSGFRPFTAPTPVAVVAQHLHEPLPSLRAVLPRLPAQVIELVERMTSKDPNGRPASHSSLRRNLEDLLEVGSATKAAIFTGTRLAIGASALAVSALALIVPRVLDRPDEPLAPVAIEKLTTRGTVEEGTLSDDGRYLAYITREGSVTALWLKDLREKSEVRLTSALDGEAPLFGVNGFSPDASYVYYSVAPPRTRGARLFRVPLIGGTPQHVVDGRSFEFSPDRSRVVAETNEGVLVANVDGTGMRLIVDSEASPIAWSPDGKRVLFFRSGSLFEGDSSGGEERKIADIPGFVPGNALSVRPDGEILALEIENKGEARSILHALDFREGTLRPIGETPWGDILRLQWLPDGSALMANASDQDRLLDQIWLVSYPDGARRAIPGDSSEYQHAWLTPDGKSVVAHQFLERSEILVSTNGERSGFQRLLTGTGVEFSLCWTRSGEIVYSSNEAGTEDLYDLYVLNPETQARRRLTHDPAGSEVDPAVSPDGRYVVFISLREGESSLWRVNIDGTGLLKLATASLAGSWWMRPQVSPDSRWVLYDDWVEAFHSTWPVLTRVSIDGGTAVPLIGPRASDLPGALWQFGFGGGWSSRGDEVGFLYMTGDESRSGEGRSTPLELAVSSLEGAISRTFPYTPESLALTWDHQRVEWSADGPDRYLYFSRNGNLWRQPLASGPATQVTRFDEFLFDFDWSEDGRRLVVSLWTRMGDVVRLTGF